MESFAPLSMTLIICPEFKDSVGKLRGGDSLHQGNLIKQGDCAIAHQQS